MVSTTGRATAGQRNPLALVALVFANANQFRSSDAINRILAEDNGLLTGEEVIGLNLDGVDLVTLSACNTARGTFAEGESVFALQTAFSLAGARSVLANLWVVDDNASAALIEEFHKNW
jgi:CHAT domain-containing protein